jgi:hypothetical protein
MELKIPVLIARPPQSGPPPRPAGSKQNPHLAENPGSVLDNYFSESATAGGKNWLSRRI